MAEHQLAHRYEGKAQGSFCRHPCAHSRRTTTANQGQGPATSARGGGLAHRRTQDVRREEILSRQPAGEDGPAHLGGHHQGEMDLRAGSPTAERRTRSRSLRGTILARPSPSCAHDDDRICLPPASPPFNSKAGKKESTGHRPSPLYQPCATPSSNSSLDHHRSDVRIAENGFATSSGVSESAKVVLGRELINRVTRKRYDLPTVGEFLPGYEATTWSGIAAPRNTPPEIINKLNSEINARLADPKLKARLADLGANALTGSSGGF